MSHDPPRDLSIYLNRWSNGKETQQRGISAVPTPSRGKPSRIHLSRWSHRSDETERQRASEIERKGDRGRVIKRARLATSFEFRSSALGSKLSRGRNPALFLVILLGCFGYFVRLLVYCLISWCYLVGVSSFLCCYWVWRVLFSFLDAAERCHSCVFGCRNWKRLLISSLHIVVRSILEGFVVAVSNL